MDERNAQTSVPIDPVLARRWSPRAFDTNRGVSRTQLAALLEAARWAPSCNGDEPWRYLIWDRSRDSAGWQKAFDCLSDNNKKWVKNVPLLMLS
jgi:nitroreductase